jgi:hypothetical protein
MDRKKNIVSRTFQEFRPGSNPPSIELSGIALAQTATGLISQAYSE